MTFNCNLCNDSFDDEYLCEIHYLNFHSNGSKCNLCGDLFRSMTHHLNRIHCDEYNNEAIETLCTKVNCKFCNHASVNIQHLIQHINATHVKVKSSCDICGKKMAKSALYCHMLNVHQSIENLYQWNCDVCDLNFKHKITYMRHLKTPGHFSNTEKIKVNNFDIENKIKEIKESNGINVRQPKIESNTVSSRSVIRHHECKLCDSKFTNKNALNQHVNRSHREPRYKCHHCDKIFRRSDQMDRHIQSVHDKTKIRCDNCHQDIILRVYYDSHLNVCLVNTLLHPYPGKSKWEKMVSKYLIENNTSF